MRLEVYLNRRKDADIIACIDAGIPLSKKMEEILKGFLTGEPVHLQLPQGSGIRMPTEQKGKMRFTFNVQTPEVLNELEKIKPHYRNMFLRGVIRFSLPIERLSIFYQDNASLLKLFNSEKTGYIENKQKTPGPSAEGIAEDMFRDEQDKTGQAEAESEESTASQIRAAPIQGASEESPDTSSDSEEGDPFSGLLMDL